MARYNSIGLVQVSDFDRNDLPRYGHDCSVGHKDGDVVDKALESHGSIGKSKWHNMPFKGTIAGAECSFPFVTLSYSDLVVAVSEVDLGEVCRSC